ncbi:MAG: hypothetical protein II671_04345 [Salinivirgaceae bacterium]|nr:hypothetical protein [Salinivirgaceae bacterium]
MEGLSNYEQIKVAQMTKKPSGVGIAGLVVGSAAAVIGIGAGIFGCMRAKSVERYSDAKFDGLRDLIEVQARTLNAERAERIEGDKTLSISINDTVSGQQQGTLTQSQQLSNEITLGLMTGKFSENPQKACDQYGLETERKWVFNEYALWAWANAIYSDQADVLARYGFDAPLADVPAEKLVTLIHAMAVSNLTDADERFNIRAYFGM